MARIRSVKPDFFRHEVLQDLEIANPGSYPMMVFAGLWGHCDSRGRFEWRPRQLKLDILPFLPFDMAATLEILERAGMVKRYSVDGKEYGEVPTFEKHQRLSGKEATEGEKHPDPIREATGKQQGSVREMPESQEGKGREEEGNGVNQAPEQPAQMSVVPGLDAESWRRWEQYRREIRKPIKSASLLAAQRQLAGYGNLQFQVVEQSIANGYQGLFELKGSANGKNGSSRADRLNNVIAELTGANRHPAPTIDGVAERVD